MMKYRIIRYLFAGGAGFLVHLGVLFALSELLDVWYLLATTTGFIVAFVVSFSLQKFWTFRNNSIEKIKKQSVQYLFVAVLNLVMNNLLMFLLVEVAHLWQVYAQILTSGTIAIFSFVIYSFIFEIKVSLIGEQIKIDHD